MKFILKLQIGVDVVVDGPANYFWEEMAQYWPKAKVILTVRDSEDKARVKITKIFKDY